LEASANRLGVEFWLFKDEDGWNPPNTFGYYFLFSSVLFPNKEGVLLKTLSLFFGSSFLEMLLLNKEVVGALLLVLKFKIPAYVLFY
jgi:hypothetical protein